MEPPIYYDLSQACKNMDESKIIELGPFARVIYFILNNSDDIESKKNDAIIPGI